MTSLLELIVQAISAPRTFAGLVVGIALGAGIGLASKSAIPVIVSVAACTGIGIALDLRAAYRRAAVRESLPNPALVGKGRSNRSA